jgi:hypothetical protein
VVVKLFVNGREASLPTGEKWRFGEIRVCTGSLELGILWYELNYQCGPVRIFQAGANSDPNPAANMAVGVW